MFTCTETIIFTNLFTFTLRFSTIISGHRFIVRTTLLGIGIITLLIITHGIRIQFTDIRTMSMSISTFTTTTIM